MYLELFCVTRNPICQIMSLIFIPLCNIHIIFAFLYIESVITSLKVDVYHIVFKKEVTGVLTIQVPYTRGEFKHTG